MMRNKCDLAVLLSQIKDTCRSNLNVDIDFKAIREIAEHAYSDDLNEHVHNMIKDLHPIDKLNFIIHLTELEELKKDVPKENGKDKKPRKVNKKRLN